MKRRRRKITIEQLIDWDRYRRRGEVLKSREELTAEKIRKVMEAFRNNRPIILESPGRIRYS